MIDQTLSHYRILEKLGEGGMGEVYRAEDTSLSRQVAIKVLPAELGHDAERLARFEREARLLAALNHPNIAAIYGLEQSEGRPFLVLELVEGQTLAERLRKGCIPLDETLDICRQVAEGLEAAHEKGVIHRDLKPANLEVTPEGRVKILDFGLAKAFSEQALAVDASRSPTITEQMTVPGTVLGTAAYMSPEQARGKTVDKRADVWAFGCVLYECLTAKRAFQGETITETLAAILKGEPDWDQLPAGTPASVRSLLRRCLEKVPRERLHDIADARIQIAEASSLPALPEAATAPRSARAWGLVGVLAGLVFGAVVTALALSNLRPVPSPPVVRAVIKVEPGLWLEGMRGELERPTRTCMAISGDGQLIVHSAIEENPGPQASAHIFARRVDQLEAARVAGTEGGIAPFLSPDDRWIGFWAQGQLKKVPVNGGVPTTLCEAHVPFGADWGPDNTVVFAGSVALGLSRVSGEGGTPEVLTVPEKTKWDFAHRLPHFLPDGSGVLFTVVADLIHLQPRLALLDLETRRWRVVMEDAADGRWLPTGHLVFLRQGTLMAVPFDLDRREASGQPVAVVANVMQALNSIRGGFNSAAGQYSVSAAGWLVYLPGGIFPDLERSLERVDLAGNIEPVAGYKAPFSAPRFSPDGRRIAYRTLGQDWRVWIYDLDRGSAAQLTGGGLTGYAVWMPDGKRLVFGWSESGPRNLYWQPSDGSSPMERLTTNGSAQAPGSVTPDGATLAFTEDMPDGGADILLLDMKSRRVTPFVSTKAYEAWPEFSPDGRWLAYASDESGRMEVYVRPFPGPGGRWLISSGGGVEPLWSRSGKQLFYRSGDKVLVADIRAEAGFSAGKPRPLFERQGLTSGDPIRSWDLWPDGQGFVMVKEEEAKPQPVTEMVLVQSWFAELERLCPTGR